MNQLHPSYTHFHQVPSPNTQAPTCREGKVTRGRLKVNLGLQTEAIEARQEEVPGQDGLAGQGVGQQVHTVQDHGAITDHGVKLELQALADALK